MDKFKNKVIYQIYPKSFLDTSGNGIGDINGIRSKLDYLANLGVDYIWLSPICKSPQKDNGYDISDYYSIDNLFGTEADYFDLIREANNKGIKVMMDLVLNHVSDQHQWFKKALQGKEEYIDYFIWRDQPNELISAFKKSAWTYSPELKKYYLHLFDSSQPDLNWENPRLRDELYEMINYWVDNGVEGFRLDVIDLIGKDPDKLIKSKGPNYIKYLNELSNSTFKDKILTVGECWNSDIDDLEEMCNEQGLTQAFHFKYLLTTKGKNKWDHNPLELKKLVKEIDYFQNNYFGNEAIVMNNHDLPRLTSFWFSNNELSAYSSKLLIMLFGLLKGNLYIYQGEEIGMTNAEFMDINEYCDVETLNYYEINPDMNVISKISRDNARTPMQWNSQPNAGFTSGIPWIRVNSNYLDINVDAEENETQSVLSMYKNIIKFRKNNYELLDCGVTFEVKENLLIMRKESGLVGYYNFADCEIDISYPQNVLFTNSQTNTGATLQPYGAVIFREKNEC